MDHLRPDDPKIARGPCHGHGLPWDGHPLETARHKAASVGLGPVAEEQKGGKGHAIGWAGSREEVPVPSLVHLARGPDVGQGADAEGQIGGGLELLQNVPRQLLQLGQVLGVVRQSTGGGVGGHGSSHHPVATIVAVGGGDGGLAIEDRLPLPHHPHLTRNGVQLGGADGSGDVGVAEGGEAGEVGVGLIDVVPFDDGVVGPDERRGRLEWEGDDQVGVVGSRGGQPVALPFPLQMTGGGEGVHGEDGVGVGGVKEAALVAVGEVAVGGL